MIDLYELTKQGFLMLERFCLHLKCLQTLDKNVWGVLSYDVYFPYAMQTRIINILQIGPLKL